MGRLDFLSFEKYILNMQKRNLSLVCLIILFLVVVFPLSSSEFTESIYQAYAEGSIDDWKPLLADIDREFRRSGDGILLLELLILEYGYIGFLQEKEEIKQSKKYLLMAMEHADQLANSTEYSASAFALKGALFGQQVNINPGRAMFLGPKSKKSLEAALELDPESSFGWIELANSTRDKPAFVGGSPEESLALFEKGITLLEKEGRTFQNWYYLNAILRLARTYRLTGDEDNALKTYNKFLSIAPGCRWIRDEI